MRLRDLAKWWCWCWWCWWWGGGGGRRRRKIRTLKRSILSHMKLHTSDHLKLVCPGLHLRNQGWHASILPCCILPYVVLAFCVLDPFGWNDVSAMRIVCSSSTQWHSKFEFTAEDMPKKCNLGSEDDKQWRWRQHNVVELQCNYPRQKVEKYSTTHMSMYFQIHIQ